MKKLLAIVMAVVMLAAMAVTVSADEVILSEDTLFFDCGNWAQYEGAETTMTALAEALATPGCYFVVTRSNESDALVHPEGYEKFFITDSWWSGRVANDEGEEINGVRLGTAKHTDAMATENGKPNDVTLDCVLDDGIKVWYDGAALLQILTDGNFLAGGDGLVFVSNTSATNYKITNISVVVPSEPIVVESAEEEAPAEEETPAVEEETPVVEETTEEEPAETGLALAVVPMVVAAAAVVLSKKR